MGKILRYGLVALLLIALGAGAVLLVQYLASDRMAMTELPKAATPDATVVGKMVEGYPREAPLWEGAQVVSSDHVDFEGFEVYDLLLVTNDPLDRVLNGYLTTLQKSGHAIRQRNVSATMVSVEASTSAYCATFLFSQNTLNQTEIATSIRLAHKKSQ